MENAVNPLGMSHSDQYPMGTGSLRDSKLLWFALLFLFVGEVAAQPDWYQNPGDLYPVSQYLVGLGAATIEQRSGRLELAADNARADLVRSIRSSISAEVYSQTTETSRSIAPYRRSHVLATASLEVDGIEIAKRLDARGTAYALAVLPRHRGRALHEAKLASLELEISTAYREAQALEASGDRSAALGSLLRLHPSLIRRDEIDAVVLALGGSRATVTPTPNHEHGSGGRVTTFEVTASIDRLSETAIESVDDLVAVLATRLSIQMPPGRRALVLPFSYGETRFSSAFSRYLVTALENRLTSLGLSSVQASDSFAPRSVDLQREIGQQAGAEAVVTGSYLIQGPKVRILAQAWDVDTGGKIGAAEAQIGKSRLAANGLAFLPPNLEQAQRDARAFGHGQLSSGGLQVEAWTNRGTGNVVFTEGEAVTLGVRVNQPCYLQITYHLANGMRVLLYQNYHIGPPLVNQAVALPDTFIVEEPLGAEVLHVFASSEPLPDTPVSQWEGYDVLAEDLPGYVNRTRGLKRMGATRKMGEMRLVMTTVPRSE